MFACYPRDIALKDGRIVTIRPMNKDDGDKLLEFFRSLPEEERMFLRDDVVDPALIQKWVEEMDYERVVPLLGLHEGCLVADASIHRNKERWASHIGQIRVVVHPDFQGSGLGYWMTREIFVIAHSMKIEKVLAEMMDVQPGAVKVFEKLGFRQEHVFKKHVCDLEGKYHNLVVMSVDINELMDTWVQAVRDSEDRGG